MPSIYEAAYYSGTKSCLAGNFNLVNTDELFSLVNIDPGEFQRQSDLAAMMEVIYHFLVKADEASPQQHGY